MTTILSLLILTLTTGEELPGQIMLSHDCSAAVAIAKTLPAGAVISTHVLSGDCLCEVPVASIECRPYRMEAGS